MGDKTGWNRQGAYLQSMGEEPEEFGSWAWSWDFKHLTANRAGSQWAQVSAREGNADCLERCPGVLNPTFHPFLCVKASYLRKQVLLFKLQKGGWCS